MYLKVNTDIEFSSVPLFADFSFLIAFILIQNKTERRHYYVSKISGIPRYARNHNPQFK